jgi:leader peptidase (prepilin peptidase)/N-methyltransferase
MDLGPFSGLPTLLATGVLTVGLLVISWIDARSLRIPDWLSLPLLGLGLLWAALQPEGAIVTHFIGAAVGYAVLALIGEVYFRRKGTEGLGLGDAKLFAAAGAWLGWQALPQVLLIASVSGLVAAMLGKPESAAKMAFGPWLALGIWLVWMWQNVLPLILFDIG